VSKSKANTIILHGYKRTAEWVAVKRVRDSTSGYHGFYTHDPRILEVLATELRCLTIPYLRHHENIATLYRIGWDRNIQGILWPTLYIEYAEFGSLESLQARSQPLESKHRLQLLSDIACGLIALHTCEIVHGDVKPANVLIFNHPMRKYIAKLADFGSAVLDATGNPSAKLKAHTPGFNAPELYETHQRELYRTDIFSFGMTAWVTLLNGYHPYLHLGEEKAKSLIDNDLLAAAAVGILEDSGSCDDIDNATLDGVFTSTLRKLPSLRNLAEAEKYLTTAVKQLAPGFPTPFG
jgi:serine/threonine protein kinase